MTRVKNVRRLVLLVAVAGSLASVVMPAPAAHAALSVGLDTGFGDRGVADIGDVRLSFPSLTGFFPLAHGGFALVGDGQEDGVVRRMGSRGREDPTFGHLSAPLSAPLGDTEGAAPAPGGGLFAAFLA